VLRPIASFSSFVRVSARFAAFAPFALLPAACSSSSPNGGSNPDAAGGVAVGDDAAAGAGSGADATGGTMNGDDAASGGQGGSSDAAAAGLGAGPPPVALGAAGSYVILAESAISNVPTSVVTGDLGLSPAAASYVTGFSPTRAGTKWTDPEVVGSIFAADNDPPTPTTLTAAVASMETAYTDAAGRPTPAHLNAGGGAIGGMTLTPGLYKWTSAVTIPSDVTLAGAPNDVWIFQISGDLSMSAAKKMTLSGGAQAKNIVWQVAGAVDFGTTSHAEGIVMSKTQITLETGASINGRLFAQTAVHIAGAAVTAP
jgi:hypothetical protein